MWQEEKPNGERPNFSYSFSPRFQDLGINHSDRTNSKIASLAFRSDVQIHAEGNVLSISGERKMEEKGQDSQETSYGMFERMITLPQGVETDKISARCEHGVLEIRVPVPTQLAGRKIPIQIDQKENKKLENKAA
jgi:HSP20 family protein